MSSNAGTPVLKSKLSKNFDSPSLKEKVSGYFDSPALKTKLSGHFTRKTRPKAGQENIRVLHQSSQNTLGWQPASSDSPKSPLSSPTTTLEYPSSSFSTQRDLEGEIIEFTPRSSPPSPAFAGPAVELYSTHKHEIVDDSLWLSSPKICNPHPQCQSSPVSKFEQPLNHVQRQFSVISHNGEPFLDNSSEQPGRNASSQFPRGLSSIVSDPEEVIAEDMDGPLPTVARARPMKLDDRSSFDLAQDTDSLCQVAPLSTPKRRLALKTQGIPQHAEKTVKYNETPFEDSTSTGLCGIERSDLTFQHDFNDALSDSSSCYSWATGHRHRRRQAQRHIFLAEMAAESSPDFTCPVQQDSSLQANAAKIPGSHRRKPVANPFYGYAANATTQPVPRPQASMPSMGFGNVTKSVALRQWDFSPLRGRTPLPYASPTAAAASSIFGGGQDPDDFSNIWDEALAQDEALAHHRPPTPEKSGTINFQEFLKESEEAAHCRQTHKKRRRLVQRYLSRAFHKLGQKATRFAGRLGEAEDHEGHGRNYNSDTSKESSFDPGHMGYDKDPSGRRGLPRSNPGAPRAPQLVIDRDQDGFFCPYGRPITDEAEQQRFNEVTREHGAEPGEQE